MKSLLLPLILTLSGLVPVVPIALGDEKDTLNAYDVKFVKETAQSSLNEVKLAKLGSQKAGGADVKALAALLVSDHSTALTELKALADKKGVTVSDTIDSKTADAFKDLEKKSGDEFDSAFIAQMDKGHVKSIKSFEDAQKEARDTDLKAWIDKTVVAIKAHHEKIKKLK